MSTFESLVQDLTRDANRAQPKDALQFCANWFQTRLEEQRARTRDTLSQKPASLSRDIPPELYTDTPFGAGRRSTSPYPQPVSVRSSFRNSIAQSPFGTLNVPGNALLSGDRTPPSLRLNQHELPPTSPLTTASPFASFDNVTPTNDDYLHPPTAAIFARRTSVSAESIDVDRQTEEPLPVHPKTDDQLRRLKVALKAAMSNNFLFRGLDEEQQSGVINSMQELSVPKDHVVIRQGDVGDYYYVVDSGVLHCYIRPEPLPPTWVTNPPNSIPTSPGKFIHPDYHPEFGKKVADCRSGNGFGELALMHGAPRAATVLAVEPSVLWSLDRITFRTIILRARHKRRTMYEKFLSDVALLSSLEAPQRSKIADALISTEYGDGEAVVRQGEMGDTFFFIEDGEAVVTKTQRSDDGELHEIEVGRLRKGDYFGELALLRLAPRAATVSAIHRTELSEPSLKVAALDAAAFKRLLGPLREIMENKAERYGVDRRLSMG
ncbi:camp-dependent protein kinase regulatory subunit [Cyathus striatus]|nr:camp-dependent protein kinase regulatory subunit [Cyathus striatus]